MSKTRLVCDISVCPKVSAMLKILQLEVQRVIFIREEESDCLLFKPQKTNGLIN